MVVQVEHMIGVHVMTVQDYVRVVRERWRLVVIALIIAILAALAAYLVRPASYTSNIDLYVSAQAGEDPQQAYQGAQLSEQRVKSYNELVTGPRVMMQTVERLGLSETPAQLANKTTSISALDSVIISISVTDARPERASAIANAVAAALIDTVNELERPASPTGNSPVAVRIVQPATLPDAPSSIGLSTILGLGVIAGLLIGLALAFARNALDVSVRNIAALNAATGLPNLAQIAYDDRIESSPLAVHDNPRGGTAEAFRQLRTNLQFVDIDSAKQVISVTSSSPSEGKTTTTANLAIAFASTDSRVLIIEGDLRRPKLSELLGLDRSVGLTQALSRRLPVSQVIQTWNGTLDVLASGTTPPNPSEVLSSNQMLSLLSELRRTYDVILIDTPPLLPVTDAAALAPSVDGVVLVCRFKTSKPQIDAAVRAISAVSGKILGTVFTMVPPTKVGRYGTYGNYYGPESHGRESTAPVQPRKTAIGQAAEDQGGQATSRLAPHRRNGH